MTTGEVLQVVAWTVVGTLFGCGLYVVGLAIHEWWTRR